MPLPLWSQRKGLLSFNFSAKNLNSLCHTYFTLHGNFRLGSSVGKHQGFRRSGKGSRRRKQMAMFALRCFSLKEAKAFNEKISYFLFPSTLLPSLTYGLETRIVFGKIPVEKFNYSQEAMKIGWIIQDMLKMFKKVECVHSRSCRRKAASSCRLDSWRKLFKVCSYFFT